MTETQKPMAKYEPVFYVSEDNLDDFEGWGISVIGWYFVGDDCEESGIMYYGPYDTEQKATDSMVDFMEMRDEI